MDDDTTRDEIECVSQQDEYCLFGDTWRQLDITNRIQFVNQFVALSFDGPQVSFHQFINEDICDE